MKTILSTEILSQAIYLLLTPITAVKSQQNEKSRATNCMQNCWFRWSLFLSYSNVYGWKNQNKVFIAWDCCIYGTRNNDWGMHASNSRNWGFETHRYLGRRYDALFLLNPDQRYSFKKDVKPFKANTGNFSTKCRAFFVNVLERKGSANEFC